MKLPPKFLMLFLGCIVCLYPTNADAEEYEFEYLSSYRGDVNDFGVYVDSHFQEHPLLGVENLYPNLNPPGTSVFTSINLKGINNFGAYVGTGSSWRLGLTLGRWTVGPTGGVSYPSRIDDNGVVVGYCNGDSDQECSDKGIACVFDGEQLHYPLSGVGEDCGAETRGMNDSSLVVGTGFLEIGEETLERGFLYDLNSRELEVIETFGGASSFASDINNDNWIVGSAELEDSSRHAFLKRPGESMIDLGTLGGPSSVALGVNDKGFVVGYSDLDDKGTRRAFLWDENNGMRDLNKLLRRGSTSKLEKAIKINELNEIIAKTSSSSGRLLRPVKAHFSNADFNGDGRGDYAVWRESSGTWYLQDSSTGNNPPLVRQWGLPGDIPLRADFDGDGSLDLNVWRPESGVWYICFSAFDYNCSFYHMIPFGLSEDYPVPADFDRDGRDDVVVWRPSIGQWFIRHSYDGQIETYQWGLERDFPVPSDFDGDGAADLAVWRPSSGTWFIRFSGKNFSSALEDISIIQWGLPSDHPFAGDYDADGRADLVVWRPENGTWYICPSRREYDCSGYGTAVQWGLKGDIPVAGSFNGNQAHELTVWRPKLGATVGRWYTKTLATSSTSGRQWGLSDDVPIGMGIRDLVKK